MRFLLPFSVLALAGFFSPVSVSAVCAGDKTISEIGNPDPTAGVPLGGGTPSSDAVPLFWTLPFQTGKMDKAVANGGLGGLEGADYTCNRIASDATAFPLTTSIVRQRAGLFKAILSNRHTDAITRFDDMAGDRPGAPPGSIVHDVMDSTGKCIASGVDDLFFAGYNLNSNLPDNEGTIAKGGSAIDFWTGSKDDGTRAVIPTGSEDAAANVVVNNAYCSSSNLATDNGWTSESGLLSAAIGTVNDASQNAASKWLATGSTKGCVNGIHLLCLQAAPTPTQPGVSQDPQFVGLQGQQFQVHGMPEEFFNLITTPTFQLNSRFTYLASGQCNYNNTECWTHPGTYVDQLGFMFPGINIKTVAGSHRKGLRVWINSEEMKKSSGKVIMTTTTTNSTAAAVAGEVSVSHPHHDVLIVSSPLFTIEVTNSDWFFNFNLMFHSPEILSAGRVMHYISDSHSSSSATRVSKDLGGKQVYPQYPMHGLVGQTWKNARYPAKRMYQGEVDDYMLLDHNLFSTQFMFNLYAY